MTLKKRAIFKEGGQTRTYLYDSAGRLLTTTSATYFFSDYQQTASEGHKYWSLINRKRHSRGRPKGPIPPDIGGGFDTRRVTVNPGGADLDTWDSKVGFHRHVVGKIYAYYAQKAGAFPDLPVPSGAIPLSAIGSLLMSRALPTNPLAGMGQFLGELRKDGIPKLPGIATWKDRANVFRRLGKNGSNEYLNIQFGWFPFVKDILDFAKTVRNQASLVEQFSRDSGKVIRRRRSLPTDMSTSEEVVQAVAYGNPTMSSTFYTTPGVLTKSTVTTVDYSFSGAFTYYLDPGLTPMGRIKRFEQLANYLYGVRLTPDLLWKLAPWSWAVDWVSTIGPVIRNFSAFQNDGLVLRYGYVTERKVTHVEYNLKGLVLKDGRTLNLTQTVTAKSTVRQRATPYGFGLNPSTFSAKQWSIIAALGISKAPRSLTF